MKHIQKYKIEFTRNWPVSSENRFDSRHSNPFGFYTHRLVAFRTNVMQYLRDCSRSYWALRAYRAYSWVLSTNLGISIVPAVISGTAHGKILSLTNKPDK